MMMHVQAKIFIISDDYLAFRSEPIIDEFVGVESDNQDFNIESNSNEALATF